MTLHELSPPEGAVRPRKRVGRGPGSGTGKTSGRGHKGARSRSGYSLRRGFEGGQMPLIRRVPKRGFHNRFRREYEVVHLADLNRFEAGSTVSAADLVRARLVRSARVRDDGDIVASRPFRYKILGDGDIGHRLSVEAHAFSASARKKIEAAGGTAVVLGSRDENQDEHRNEPS